MRMNQDVLRQTWQAPASSLGDIPASAPSAYAAHVAAESLDMASTDPVLAEKVLPHERHFHLWSPWESRSLRKESEDPHPGHLSGDPASADPAISPAMRAFSFSRSSRSSAIPSFCGRCSIMESIWASVLRCLCLAACIAGGGPDNIGPFSGQSWSNSEMDMHKYLQKQADALCQSC